MRTTNVIPVALIIMLLVTFGCSTTSTEGQSTAEPAPPVEQPEPQIATPTPAPEPVAKVDDGRTLFLDQLIFFDFDSTVLRPEAQAILQSKAQWLRDNPDVVAVIIEGHCDERGTNAYNVALGAKRAEAVKNYLIDLGVEISRLQTKSYGEEKPVAFGKSEEAWSQNRRANFVIN